MPNGEKSGWIIPTELRKRWSLVIGLSESHLIGIMDCIGQIEIIFHDSDHTYKNMLFEFSSAWEFLSAGGMVISDDINLNDAFDNFCNQIDYKVAAVYDNSFGVIVK